MSLYRNQHMPTILDEQSQYAHKRPLPPPQSRSVVLQELLGAAEWTVIDQDLEIAMPRKRRRVEDNPFAKRGITNQESQKKCLFNSSSLRQKIRKQNADEPITPVCKSNDEGYVSFENSSETTEEIVHASHLEQEAFTLVQLVESTSSETSQLSDKTTNDTREVRALKSRENAEQNGQELSRLLRQQNINTCYEPSLRSTSSTSDGGLYRETPTSPYSDDSATMMQVPHSVDKVQQTETLTQLAPLYNDEALLDVVQDFVMAQSGSKEQLNTSKASKQQALTLTKPGPFSRNAANVYRSQGRHLDIDNYSNKPETNRQAMNEAGAKRLLEIKGIMQNRDGVIPHATILDQIPTIAALPRNMPALVKPLPRKVFLEDIQPELDVFTSNMTLLERSDTTVQLSQNSSNSFTNQHGVSSQQRFNITRDYKTIGKDPLSWKPRSADTPRAVAPPTDAIVTYEEQGQNLQLPASFDTFAKSMQDIIIRHETCKERVRDLDAILTTMKDTANAGVTRRFEIRELDELRFAKTFASKTLHEGLSGKLMRKRLLEIGANMRRRLIRGHVADAGEAKAFYDKILRPEEQDWVLEERRRLQGDIESLGAIRRGAKEVKKKSAKVKRAKAPSSRKSVKFADIERDVNSDSSCFNTNTTRLTDGTTLDLSDDDETLKLKKARRSEIARQSQLARLSKYENKLREQDKRFSEALNQNVSYGSNDDPTTSLLMDESDAQSDVSEEDEGAQHYAGTRTTCTSQTEQVDNHPDSQSPIGTEPRVQLPTQQPNESLVQELQLRQKRLSIPTQQGAQTLDVELLAKTKNRISTDVASIDEGASSNGFEDSEGSDNYQSDDERVCYRYVVKSFSIGITGREDDCEYRENHYLNLEKANRQAVFLLDDLRGKYMASIDFDKDSNIKTTDEMIDGYKDCSLEIGQDARGSFRVWVDQEEYRPSQEKYENARVRRACLSKPVYIAMWERIISPYFEDVEEVNEDDQTTNNPEEDNAPDRIAVHTDQDGGLETSPPKCGPGTIVVSAGDIDMAIQDSHPVSTVDEVKQNDNQIINHSDSSSQTTNTIQDDDKFDANSISHGVDDDDDDLFGPDMVDTPSQPNAVPSSKSTTESEISNADKSSSSRANTFDEIVTTISVRETRPCANIAQANRFAKEHFMTWWTGHLRGPENWPYIRIEEQLMEDELKRYGSRTTWEKDDEFVVEYEDGTKVLEKFRVWVEAVKVYGPSN